MSAKVGEYPENEDQPAVEQTSQQPDKPDDQGSKIDSLGIDLATLDQKGRDKYNLSADTEGVLVVDVARTGRRPRMICAPATSSSKSTRRRSNPRATCATG